MRNETMIDIHCHILPGLDDGARSMEESIEMAYIAVENGISVVVATPHANQRGRFENYCTPYMQYLFEEFCAQLKIRNIPLKVLQGMEIYASMDAVKRIQERELCSLAGTSYYLVEFPFHSQQPEMDAFLQKMLRHGYIPVVAHPERYRCVQKYPDIVWNWRNMGCVVQVNAGSICGQFGADCKITAQKLLETAQVDVLASDAHGSSWRVPQMKPAWTYLEQRYGYEFARKLLKTNAEVFLKRL